MAPVRTNLEAVRESAAFPCTVAQILRQQRVKGLAASQGFAWLPLSLSLSVSPLLSRGGACEPEPIRRHAMAKFNVVQKNKRQWKQDRKRAAHGEPGTGKLKQRTAPVSMSGKRKRKLERRLNRVGPAVFFSGMLFTRAEVWRL